MSRPLLLCLSVVSLSLSRALALSLSLTHSFSLSPELSGPAYQLSHVRFIGAPGASLEHVWDGERDIEKVIYMYIYIHRERESVCV